MTETLGKWKLEGWDTFSREDYPLPGEYNTEEEARTAAADRLSELEKTQPSATSGGQKGIQDKVFILSPTGSRTLYIP